MERVNCRVTKAPLDLPSEREARSTVFMSFYVVFNFYAPKNISFNSLQGRQAMKSACRAISISDQSIIIS